MPSALVDLGRYVTLRPRADGTQRVYFQVPARLRPSDWPSLIPLPIRAPRSGNLGDLVELARIKADAAKLYGELQQVRLGRERAPTSPATGRTIRALVRAWQASSAYKDLKPRSQKHYGTYINHLLAWSETCDPQHPDPTLITRADVEGLLAAWDDAATTKKHVRKTMRLVMDQAVALGWRGDNPCDGIRLAKSPRSRAAVWEQGDVDLYVAAAEQIERPSIALMILMEWEIGQRLGDARLFRPGGEYDAEAGVFRFWQEKTQSYVTIPISPRLRELLNDAAEGELFLFRNEETGKAYTEERLSKTFAWVRNAARKAGARYLQLRWLRHSCVVHLARAGCTVPEIAAITGHSATTVTKLLDTYLPRDNLVAWNAQEKRGLVARESA